MTRAVKSESLSQRSRFVDVVARSFIALAGIATLIGIVQNLWVRFVIPSGRMPRRYAPGDAVPDLIRFLVENRPLIFGAFLVISIATLIAAIGLLHRRNWARWLFIGMLSLGIALNLGGLVIQRAVLSAMVVVPADASFALLDQLDRMSDVVLGFSVVAAMGFCALFGWLIRRLTSRAISAEFCDPPATVTGSQSRNPVTSPPSDVNRRA